MGALIWHGLLVFMLPGLALASGADFSQVEKDSIREHHTRLILRTGKPITVLQPDVRVAREIFSIENSVAPRPLLEPDPIPWVQLFKKQDLSLGETLEILSKASGYDLAVHPQIDLNQTVKLNGQQNSLRDIAEYLSRISNSHISVFKEARMLTVNRSYR